MRQPMNSVGNSKEVYDMKNDSDYTIAELFEMLKNDDSWEPDPQKREEIANAFYASIQFL